MFTFKIPAILSLIISFSIPALSIETIKINKTSEKIQIGSYVEYFKDESGSFTIKDILEKTIVWKTSNNDLLSFGFSRFPYWLKFSINNRSSKIVKLLLKEDYPTIDYIELFTPVKPGKYISKVLGDRVPFNRREITDRNPIFILNVKPGISQYYIRIQSYGALNAPLLLLSPEQHTKDIQFETPILWVYYGLMISMIIYNFFIFLSIKDNSYLYYRININSTWNDDPLPLRIREIEMMKTDGSPNDINYIYIQTPVSGRLITNGGSCRLEN